MNIETPTETKREIEKNEMNNIKTFDDYDAALEDYCREVREARGWTTTDPRSSIGSSVIRWNQDGLDYRDFRDRVLLYGLDIENQFIETGVPPCTLEEFKAHLRTILCKWTYQDIM